MKTNKIQRKQGHLQAVGAKKRSISFSFQYLDNTQGQSIKISQYAVEECLRLQYIKQYTKVTFPPTSKFKEPKHVTPDNWAVIHIKPKSKEVVAGFLENDVFYIVFLDKEHDFWDTNLQDRNKNRK